MPRVKIQVWSGQSNNYNKCKSTTLKMVNYAKNVGWKENWDPSWGPQLSSNMRWKLKLQPPMWICVSLCPHLHLHCHYSLTDKIFKERELGVSVTLVRPRLDSNLLSKQCLWEVWCLFCSRVPLSLYSHQEPGNEMNMQSQVGMPSLKFWRP